MADTKELESSDTVTEHAPKQIVRSDKYVTLYTNQVELGYSAWDVQFSLIQVHGRSSDVVGEEIATITMSPQHAKAMVIPLLNTIIQYETKHGVIQIPGQTEPVSLSNMIKAAVDKKREVDAAAAEAAKKEPAEKKEE